MALDLKREINLQTVDKLFHQRWQKVRMGMRANGSWEMRRGESGVCGMHYTTAQLSDFFKTTNSSALEHRVAPQLHFVVLFFFSVLGWMIYKYSGVTFLCVLIPYRKERHLEI